MVIYDRLLTGFPNKASTMSLQTLLNRGADVDAIKTESCKRTLLLDLLSIRRIDPDPSVRKKMSLLVNENPDFNVHKHTVRLGQKKKEKKSCLYCNMSGKNGSVSIFYLFIYFFLFNPTN